MDERLSRPEILEQLQTEYSLLMKVINRFNYAEMVEPGAVGEWSVKDVLAHLIVWTQFPVQEVWFVRFIGKPLEFNHDERDAFNARVVDGYRHLTPQQIVAHLDGAFQGAIDCIEALPDEAFEPGNTLECLLGDTISGTFGNNTYEHYALHRRQIEVWMEHTGVTND